MVIFGVDSDDYGELNMKRVTIFVVVLLCLISISVQAEWGPDDLEGKGDFFSIAQIADTQYLASLYPANYRNWAYNLNPDAFQIMTDWIVSHKEQYNFKFVTHVGDITQDSGDPQEMSFAWNCSKTLRDNGIPFLYALGNHDYGYKRGGPSPARKTHNYTAFFNSTMYRDLYNNQTDYCEWGGDYWGSYNSYVTFETNGYKFIVITVQFFANSTTWQWCNETLTNHSDYHAIIVTHGAMDHNDNWLASGEGSVTAYDDHADSLCTSTTGETFYNGDDQWEHVYQWHDNIMLFLCGHIGHSQSSCTGLDIDSLGNYRSLWTAYRNDTVHPSAQTGNFDVKVHSRMIDFTRSDNNDPPTYRNGGNGTLSWYEIHPDNNTILVRTYKVNESQWYNSTNPTFGDGTWEKFNITYDFSLPGGRAIHNAPETSHPTPANGSTDNNITINWSVYLEDDDGDLMNYTLECNNSQTISDDDVGNGTYNFTLSGLSYNTTYTVWVNVTDDYNTTNDWFDFTTKDAPASHTYSRYCIEYYRPIDDGTGSTIFAIIGFLIFLSAIGLIIAVFKIRGIL